MLKRRQMHYLISLRIGLLPQQSHISLSIGLDRLHMDSQGYKTIHKGTQRNTRIHKETKGNTRKNKEKKGKKRINTDAGG